MSRFLEGIFVLGSCLVGLAISSPGSSLQEAMDESVQLVSHVEDNIAGAIVSKMGTVRVRALSLHID